MQRSQERPRDAEVAICFADEETTPSIPCALVDTQIGAGNDPIAVPKSLPTAQLNECTHVKITEAIPWVSGTHVMILPGHGSSTVFTERRDVRRGGIVLLSVATGGR